MEVYQILFIVWVIVFAFWLARQFKEHNDRTDR
jgi:positive regulator of sigma E activity